MGHNAYAQVIVLVIFLGGMAIGALLTGRMSERIREPLLTYSMVEATVGVIGLVFHNLYLGVTGWAYHSVFPHPVGGALLTVAKWGIAAALILPQSVLLGMTFPLMTAGALRRIGERPGRTISLLYFANSFGAAVGVLVAGFYLVPALGLPGTMSAAATLNFLAAIGAVVAIRLGRPAAPGPGPVHRCGRRSGGARDRFGKRRLGVMAAIACSQAPPPLDRLPHRDRLVHL